MWHPAARALAIDYVPILAPSLILPGPGSVLAAAFQSRPPDADDRPRLAGRPPGLRHHDHPALADWLGLTALAIAITGQQIAIVVVFLAPLGIGTRMLPPAIAPGGSRGKRPVRLIAHSLPLTISSSALMFNLLIDRAIATLIVPGGVSALRYAEGVIRILLNAIGPAWSAAIYPALVRASRQDGGGSLGEAASGALRYVTRSSSCPLAVATAALAPLIVAVAYGRGAFDRGSEYARDLGRARGLCAAAVPDDGQLDPDRQLTTLVGEGPS